MRALIVAESGLILLFIDLYAYIPEPPSLDC